MRGRRQAADRRSADVHLRIDHLPDSVVIIAQRPLHHQTPSAACAASTAAWAAVLARAPPLDDH